MQVDFSKILKNFDGTEIKERPNSEQPFTLRAAAVKALSERPKSNSPSRIRPNGSTWPWLSMPAASRWTYPPSRLSWSRI